jgi:hypothetical protein
MVNVKAANASGWRERVDDGTGGSSCGGWTRVIGTRKGGVVTLVRFVPEIERRGRLDAIFVC